MSKRRRKTINRKLTFTIVHHPSHGNAEEALERLGDLIMELS